MKKAIQHHLSGVPATVWILAAAAGISIILHVATFQAFARLSPGAPRVLLVSLISTVALGGGFLVARRSIEMPPRILTMLSLVLALFVIGRGLVWRIEADSAGGAGASRPVSDLAGEYPNGRIAWQERVKACRLAELLPSQVDRTLVFRSFAIESWCTMKAPFPRLTLSRQDFFASGGILLAIAAFGAVAWWFSRLREVDLVGLLASTPAALLTVGTAWMMRLVGGGGQLVAGHAPLQLVVVPLALVVAARATTIRARVSSLSEVSLGDLKPVTWVVLPSLLAMVASRELLRPLIGSSAGALPIAGTADFGVALIATFAVTFAVLAIFPRVWAAIAGISLVVGVLAADAISSRPRERLDAVRWREAATRLADMPIEKRFAITDQVRGATRLVANAGPLGAGPARASLYTDARYRDDLIGYALLAEGGLPLFFGCLALLVLLVAEVVAIARDHERPFARGATAAMAALLAVPVALAFLAPLRLGPLVGVSAPFLTYSASSLLTALLAVGVVAGLGGAVMNSMTGGARQQSREK